ncbi:MAG TPA: RimK family alpha-L-glutamate ligase [Candidatus Desulfofervidus auxilii]|uniref:RimK family alpha-L-glutamate ligase n=1 Tax=Desulfofervidus auxilii TaxID=1621989 RepID=A0A7C0Y3B2_DESA2|nr:RimK family alpha-L-glutamate ligase [Candidatus Desulfofervidus auxilii]
MSYKGKKPKVAIGNSLAHCKQVITLGVRTNFSDYKPWEQKLIREAEKIYYPTSFYADLFKSMGKPTFPSFECYAYAMDKIKQTTLFNLLNIPHPYTRIFYGERQKKKILNYFSYPFIAKIPRASALGEGVFLIKNDKELFEYNRKTRIAYIQEYLEIEKDIRVVLINYKVVLAYWRIKKQDEYRCNIAQGAEISFDPVPEEAIELAIKTSKLCNFNNVGIDICIHNGKLYVLEANMVYGKKGFQKAGIDYKKLLAEMLEKGEI